MKSSTIIGVVFWALIATGAFFLDKGQNGDNITVTQFFGAVSIFLAGWAGCWSLQAQTEESQKKFAEEQRFTEEWNKTPEARKLQQEVKQEARKKNIQK